MDTFEELLEAIEAYSDANASYKKAREGAREAYFFSRESTERDRTKKRLREALDAHIRHVILSKEV